ncbi:hypothetical protein PISMIDRAFT_106710 [Pisolithus microcarpus 441]|uniref:Uncharacterized protein n=1 Tax=Pisolithus microcarpus 441 TaxID=765257 RepID=A0A0C9ZIX0_9AGAM|nr:hypothetical protein PISMIDRAFT_106710 [Pisolithus microcarpus 441]
MPEILKRKPHDPPTAVPSKWWKIGATNLPCTSAQLSKTTSHLNLTLSDWMNVYSYIDSHLDCTQSEIVHYFSTLSTRALIFDQSTLSHKLQDHPKMESHVHENPTALSSKQPCMVTDQMLNMHFIYGFSTWKIKAKLLQVPCFKRNV